jgi:hypothetical protein
LLHSLEIGSNKKLRTFLFILPFFYLNAGYSQDLFFEDEHNSKIKNEIVAEVGPLKITAEEFIYNYEFGPAFPKRKDNSKQTHLNYMINEKLLALDGYEKGLMEKEFAKGMYSDIESDLITEELFKKEILPKVDINGSEIEKVIDKKLSEYEIRWLYASDLKLMQSFFQQLKNGIPFDTLFNAQLNDSVFMDDRQIKSSLYNIYVKNPIFAQIIDTLSVGDITAPIHSDDGWYIIKIDNIWKNLITNETDYNKLKSESVSALTKSKMDILSDQYVKGLFESENPTIKREVFNILRSYIGEFFLSPEKYSGWELDIKLEAALSNLGLKKNDKFTGLTLVDCKNINITLDEFIIWYRNREQYIKLSKSNLIDYSKSLENLVWLMIRDKLLTTKAYQAGYDESDWVKRQAGWWRDKITYSVNRNELVNSVTLNYEEMNQVDEKKSRAEIINEELSKKIFYTLNELKKKYKIKINEEILGEIKVSADNDREAIDMYIVKRGNLIPRPAYPSIDNDWVNWE